MTNLQNTAQQILGLIDLTSLNDSDTNPTIERLCSTAITPFGNVPAICIYPQFIDIAKQHLSGSHVKIATVTNFPHGSINTDIALIETQSALDAGANEIDIVFPYNALINGNSTIGADMVKKAKYLCGSNTLKVIIESGELKTPELIKLASEISINNGADFIKTSTGKVQINATLSAAEIMLNVIKSSGTNCGFKAAGGVKAVAEATKYLILAEEIMGIGWIHSDHFRFGASGLLGDVIAILENKPRENIFETY